MKDTYLISYDLNGGSSSDYEELHKAIKAYGIWAHITKSLWAIVTDKTAETIRNDISPHLPEDSNLIVVESAHTAAWGKVQCSDGWLHNYL